MVLTEHQAHLKRSKAGLVLVPEALGRDLMTSLVDFFHS